MTNKINIYDGTLSEVLLDNVIRLVNAKGFKYGWKSNKNVDFGHWNLGFSDTGRARLNRTDVTDELPEEVKVLWHQIQTTLLKNHPILLRAYCNAYTFGTEGYIHRDSKFEEDITAIIYLNAAWKADWAGETILLESGEIVKSVLPKWNRILIFPAKMRHAARGVSRFCPEARKVLVFKATTQQTEQNG